MNNAEKILRTVRQETDDVILFSSILGKDSILLTHYCSLIFRKVTVVFMYIVKDLDHVMKYQRFFERRYPNIKYLNLPHYCISSFVKVGYLGLRKDPKQKAYTLANIDQIARDQTGLRWSVYGMKKSDSMNRRLQLNGYPDGICHASNKVYPLKDMTNKQVIGLIDYYRLPKPVTYVEYGQSSGEDLENPNYLNWLYENYPEDLRKTFEAFPGTKTIFYESEYYKENPES